MMERRRELPGTGKMEKLIFLPININKISVEGGELPSPNLRRMATVPSFRAPFHAASSQSRTERERERKGESRSREDSEFSATERTPSGVPPRKRALWIPTV